MSDVQILISAYEKHTGFVNNLWSIFQIISIALLGFVYKEPALREWHVLLPLSVAFVFLAIGNLRAMLRSQRVIIAASDEMRKINIPDSPSVEKVLNEHTALKVKSLRLTHHGFTGLVVILTWLSILL